MSKTRLIKILGLVGAAVTAAVFALNGDYTSAVAAVSASLASASGLKGEILYQRVRDASAPRVQGLTNLASWDYTWKPKSGKANKKAFNPTYL